MKNVRWLWGIAAILYLASGCVPMVVGGAAVGTGASTYYYARGGVWQGDYKYPYDKVWEACEKTLADMHAVDVQPLKAIAQGTIKAVINDEKVQVDVYYKERNMTVVAIRVGLLGNKIASQMLHDKVSDNIAK